ncbi:MAG: hypothetical protein L0G23_00580 [Ruaniaceae bacterium]|nr:hypothetical protein [Ruaniaceae bacterium]
MVTPQPRNWYGSTSGATPRRPVSLDPVLADEIEGAPDPAEHVAIAHATAWAFVDGGRANPDDPQRAELLESLVRLGEAGDIELIADMWANAGPLTLPGALWRMYAIREWVRRDSGTVTDAYRRGLSGTDAPTVIAGLADAPEPAGVARSVDQILEGVYDGELDVAFDRASALLTILAAGIGANASSLAPTDTDRSAQILRRADNLVRTAGELAHAARLSREGTLE